MVMWQEEGRSVMRVVTRIFACLLAGAVGGMVCGVVLWGLNAAGIATFFNFSPQPVFRLQYFTPLVLFGTVWGLLFLIPGCGRWCYLRGLAFSLIPSLVVLLRVLPNRGWGLLGLEHSPLTPLLVIVLGAVWGLSAAAWLRVDRTRL